MHVDEQQILSISRELWVTQLGLNIVPAESGSSAADGDRILTSYVRISGPWQGTIMLECPESVARHAAVMLFATDGDEASAEDIQDALGELVDMMAKKMRPFLPEETKLSRPSTFSASEPLVGMKGVHELNLDCEGRPVRIALFESEPAPASAA